MFKRLDDGPTPPGFGGPSVAAWLAAVVTEGRGKGHATLPEPGCPLWLTSFWLIYYYDGLDPAEAVAQT